MRPQFDEAARAAYAATKAGLFVGITPEQVIALGTPRAVTAWQSLPAHAAVLDQIAAVRNAMTDVLGIAPDPDPFGPRQYGAAFGTGWVPNISGRNRWLQLSSGMPEPLTLLTVAETRRAANATRATPRPAVTPEHAGQFAQLVGNTGPRHR